MLSHDNVPGYQCLSRPDRLRADSLAALHVLLSWQSVHVLAAVVIWLLLGHLLVWRLDLRGVSADLPFLTVHLWLLPWLAILRRRALRHVLGPHWTEL